MKLTKEDYMRLPKERLAELLVEMQDELPSFVPIPTYPIETIKPWQPPYTVTPGRYQESTNEIKN